LEQNSTNGSVLNPSKKQGAELNNPKVKMSEMMSTQAGYTIKRSSLIEKKVETCFLCGQPSEDECCWCRAAFFCGPEHQAIHRSKTRCSPWKVAEIPGKGRGLVATRTIRPRETILVERAILAGPSLVSSPVCPSCLAPLHPPLLPCTKCGLPVCSPSCQENPVHREECKLLSSNRVKVEVRNCEVSHPIYSFILPYRLLRMRVRDPAAWARVASLVDHIQERANTVEWEVETKEVVSFLRRRCFLAKEYSEEDIHRAIGICAINSVTLEPRRLFQGPAKGVSGRAIFPTFALTNHSCMSNARFTVESGPGGGTVRIEAKDEIKKGEEITVQYYSSVLGTHKRRRRLKAEWYFWCMCPRCKDPSELKTNVAGVTCELCEQGVMLPRDPLDQYSDWPCNKCDFSLEVPDLERKIDQMEEELNDLSAKKDLKRLEFFVKELQGAVLHPNHYLLLIARRNYQMICHKRLIIELSRCRAGEQEEVKEKWGSKVRAMQDLAWVPKLLLGEESF